VSKGTCPAAALVAETAKRYVVVMRRRVGMREVRKGGGGGEATRMDDRVRGRREGLSC
jgi:hypothetical protein